MKQQTSSRELLTPNQLAERWYTSPGRLANDRCAGIGVPYVKIGRSVLYRLDDVLAFEDAHRVEVAA